jgi:hypothetical protein
MGPAEVSTPVTLEITAPEGYALAGSDAAGVDINSGSLAVPATVPVNAALTGASLAGWLPLKRGTDPLITGLANTQLVVLRLSAASALAAQPAMRRGRVDLQHLGAAPSQTAPTEAR